MPHPAAGQLGKVSLVSDDAVAMSGPEDRGFSVLMSAGPGGWGLQMGEGAVRGLGCQVGPGCLPSPPAWPC